ncbi:hypothetical protein Dimus_032075 [Dionaea muscipula]
MEITMDELHSICEAPTATARLIFMPHVRYYMSVSPHNEDFLKATSDNLREAFRRLQEFPGLIFYKKRT